MSNEILSQYNKLLENLAGELDISESRFKQAEERYKAIGKWLLRDGSSVVAYDPDIYPQGSFLLGTLIKPLTDEEEYDIDLVCVLNITKAEVSQKQLKGMVGREIKDYAKANSMKSMPEDKRRCWTLNYSDGAHFHMDILPGLPDGDSFQTFLERKGFSANWTDFAVAITDKSHPNYDHIGDDWLCSNPKGYAEWFKERMKIRFDAQIKSFAESIRASIADVPEYKVKTPLQRAVQILKRHRDMRFIDHAMRDDKPISMIITTLSAKLYENEEDIYSALKNIVDQLDAHAGLLNPGFSLNESLMGLRLIEKRADGTWYIPNPVNPAENFADRWHEDDNRKARAFFQWVAWIRSDLIEVLRQPNIEMITKLLGAHFGESITKRASTGLYTAVAPAILTRAKEDIPHVEIRNASKPWSTGG